MSRIGSRDLCIVLPRFYCERDANRFLPVFTHNNSSTIDVLRRSSSFSSHDPPQKHGRLVSGGFFYLDLKKPALRLPLETAKKQIDYVSPRHVTCHSGNASRVQYRHVMLSWSGETRAVSDAAWRVLEGRGSLVAGAVIVLLLLQGRDIVTQVGQGDFGFFRLHLNHFNMVEGITCLAKDVRDDDVIMRYTCILFALP